MGLCCGWKVKGTNVSAKLGDINACYLQLTILVTKYGDILI